MHLSWNVTQKEIEDMKKDAEHKIVIIGMGYLMEYIAPCYKKMLGEHLADQVLGVTVDREGLEEKSKNCGFPVILDDNLGALNRIKPDLIFFAPPPSVAPALTETVLKPYYENCRADGREIPMLFAFPPNPEGKFYQSALGEDLKVVNILPNMIREIAGKPSELAGFSMVTLPEKNNWSEEELLFLERFWNPLGQVIFLSPQEVKAALAVSCSNQMLGEVLLDMQQMISSQGEQVEVKEMAQAARAYFLDKFHYSPPQPVPGSMDVVSDRLLEAIKKVTYHAYKGTLRFMTEKGFEPEKAEQIQKMNYDLNLRKVQLMDREELRKTTRKHATRGGVLECACISYTQKWQKNVKDHFRNYPEWIPDAEWAQELEQGFEDISEDVYGHLQNLSAKREPKPCQIEHHAVLYALLEKEAVDQAGESGRQAMSEATAQYGMERGKRMRQNALLRGDHPDAFTYLAYGEWSAAPGVMVVEEQTDRSDYTTHVTRCEWCRCWEKHDLMEYGKAYCTNVDVNIAHGYEPTFDLMVNSLMSAGDPFCEFGYGFEMTPEQMAELEEIKKKIGVSAQKDFNYHTAHLLATCKRVLKEQLGETAGQDIADAALFDFTRRFGSAYTDSILALEGTDFQKI